MPLSVFDLYSIGIGPSSSHTVGPMRAAKRFADELHSTGLAGRVERVSVELFGSLGATGHGYGSAKAVILGLEGADAATVDTETADDRVHDVERAQCLRLLGTTPIAFLPDTDLVLHRRKSLPGHPNGMLFRAYGVGGESLTERVYYSVGGGFVVDEEASGSDRIVSDPTVVRYPFSSGADLLEICARERLRISDVMLANELSWRSEDEVRNGLLHLWRVMVDCVERGCHRTGVLPGGLGVPRRAPGLYQRLLADTPSEDPMQAAVWVNLFALAVNEENASGGRIVTAPTNGAAGIIPAVLLYYHRFIAGADEDGIVRFLLTAGAIGILFKENASISGAEVGCQGEVGSACAMAAGALCEVLGGTPEQVENAAEVGIEHNLGLTCDPVGGLVQIPCIERNAIASVKAINAARLAQAGDGTHKVSLE